MTARLDAAIARLAREGGAAVARVHGLRAELAAAEVAAFEAEHALRLAALRLHRASRPRVVMPADAGPVGPLVSYREPPSPVGKRAPAGPSPWPSVLRRGLG